MELELIDDSEWNRIQPMLQSSEKARTDEQYRPLCYEEKYRLSCTKSKPLGPAFQILHFRSYYDLLSVQTFSSIGWKLSRRSRTKPSETRTLEEAA